MFRRVTSLLFVFSALLASASAHAEVLVVRNVNVVPMDEERVLPDQTVIIEDGVIQSISASADGDFPDNAQVIDGSGKYLMPGLAEMHAHVPGAQPEHYAEDVLFLYLANGVTLIRSMLGEPLHLEMREQLATGELLGPRMIAAGPSFNGRSAPTPERGAELAREQKAAGYDFIKIISGSREAFDAMVEAANEVGIGFAGHVPGDVGLPRALEAGYGSVDHLDGYMRTLVDPEKVEGIDGGFFGYRLAPYVEEARISEMAEKTRDAGVWNVPTGGLIHSVLIVDPDTVREERPEFRYMPPDIIEGWMRTVRNIQSDNYDRETAEAYVQVRSDLIRALHEAGAGLLLGSDAPQFFNVPGFSIQRELELMARAGLSPYEVLRMGTVNPAKYLGEAETSGKVVEGAPADLLLVEANPLEDVTHVRQIAGVIRGGNWLSREAIDDRLETIADRYAAGR